MRASGWSARMTTLTACGIGMDYLEIHQIDRLEDQREVAGIGRQLLLGLGAVAHIDGKRHAGMLGAIARDLLRQEIWQQRLRAGDRDMAAPLASEVRDLALDARKVRKPWRGSGAAASSPAGLSRTPLGSRSKSSAPNSSSKRLMRRFSAEAVMFMSSAALRIEPARATASISRNVCRCLIGRILSGGAFFAPHR